MADVGWRLQQVDGFHPAVERIERHHHGIGGIAPGDHRHVRIFDHAVDDLFEVVASVREADDLHGHLNTVAAPLNTLSAKDLCPGTAALEKINASLR